MNFKRYLYSVIVMLLIVSNNASAITIDSFERIINLKLNQVSGTIGNNNNSLLGGQRAISYKNLSNRPSTGVISTTQISDNPSQYALSVALARGDDLITTLKYSTNTTNSSFDNIDLSADGSTGIVFRYSCDSNVGQIPPSISITLTESGVNPRWSKVTLDLTKCSINLNPLNWPEAFFDFSYFINTSNSSILPPEIKVERSLNGGLTSINKIQKIQVEIKNKYISGIPLMISALRTNSSTCSIVPTNADIKTICSVEGGQKWQNTTFPQDVTNDGKVSIYDLNALKQEKRVAGLHAFLTPRPNSAYYLDPDGNNKFTALDFLAVNLAATNFDGSRIYLEQVVNLATITAQERLLLEGDIARFCEVLRLSKPDPFFDLDKNGAIQRNDFIGFILLALNTKPGDANLDGLMTSEDLIIPFQSGQYEDQIKGNSTWRTGDWNCDSEFDSSDIQVLYEFGGLSDDQR